MAVQGRCCLGAFLIHDDKSPRLDLLAPFLKLIVAFQPPPFSSPFASSCTRDRLIIASIRSIWAAAFRPG
jgi:hypothetical protein